jgi:hypothetical protein
MLDLDGELRLYMLRKGVYKNDFFKSIAGVWWGAHPRCMNLLYRGLVGSVLEYGSACFSGMAHMLRLESV